MLLDQKNVKTVNGVVNVRVADDCGKGYRNGKTNYFSRCIFGGVNVSGTAVKTGNVAVFANRNNVGSCGIEVVIAFYLVSIFVNKLNRSLNGLADTEFSVVAVKNNRPVVRFSGCELKMTEGGHCNTVLVLPNVFKVKVGVA